MSDHAREAALTALERCRRSGAWSAATIDKAIEKYSLSGKSAALASNICLGTLQNSALCDHYIDVYNTSGKKIEPKVRDILRTAVYQLLFMDRIPPSAAVDEAVSLCKSCGFARAAGFVNALLRRLSSEKDELPPIPGEGTAAYLALRYSHPLWLAEELCAENGYEFTEAFFAENNKAAETTIQVNTLKTTAEALAELKISGNITQLPGFAEGLFYVQDDAARCAVSIAGLKPGMKVLDACAAPGGKSFAAALDMRNTGSILACDIHEKKLGLIEDGAKRLGIDMITTAAHDARQPFDAEFDAVIADVPCSGLGVIRKKPEIRNKAQAELSGLPEIQSAILENLSQSVKRGGVLLYSTCTVRSCENGDVVNAFLADHEDFSAESFTLPDGRDCPTGMHTFWPNIDKTDGFFVAKLRRKA